MTGRTRWTALSEELEDPPPEPPEPPASSFDNGAPRLVPDQLAAELTTKRIRNTTNVLVHVDGATIVATDVRMTVQSPADTFDSMPGLPEVRGSLRTPWTGRQLVGRDLMMLVLRNDEVLRFALVVTQTAWQEDTAMVVDFKGVRVS